jgi:hypothetical protein
MNSPHAILVNLRLVAGLRQVRSEKALVRSLGGVKKCEQAFHTRTQIREVEDLLRPDSGEMKVCAVSGAANSPCNNCPELLTLAFQFGDSR